MPDYREVDDEVKKTKKDDYEDICYMCRRPESVAGKLIHLPMENICICPDCMEKSFSMMNSTPINYEDIMKNMNFRYSLGILEIPYRKASALKRKSRRMNKNRQLI